MHCRVMAPTGLAVGLILATGTVLSAIYVRTEVRRVPAARLIANLEQKLAAEPANVQHVINLARLHGMVFALKSVEVPAAAGRGDAGEEPFYGHEPKLIPYENRAAVGKAVEELAREHLAKALTYYERALELDPGNLLATLGYGWMLEQAGQTARAIELYRRVIARAWPREQEQRVSVPGSRFYTHEAAGYLIPLLDPRRDAKEIADLRAKQERLSRLPRAITPIAVPLADDVDPALLFDPSTRVLFDADGSGLRRPWSWIGPQAAWLVHDADESGRITSALQLFGSVTFWLFWENGYQALAALDDNHDGEIAGTETEGLALWQDANGNGVSEAGEVARLETHGIVALSCRHAPGDGVRYAAVSTDGARFEDGRVRPTYDVILRAGHDRLTLTVPPGRHHAILEDGAGQHEKSEDDERQARLRQRE